MIASKVQMQKEYDHSVLFQLSLASEIDLFLQSKSSGLSSAAYNGEVCNMQIVSLFADGYTTNELEFAWVVDKINFVLNLTYPLIAYEITNKTTERCKNPYRYQGFFIYFFVHFCCYLHRLISSSMSKLLHYQILLSYHDASAVLSSFCFCLKIFVASKFNVIYTLL
jgi:hypothetical protein